MMEPPGGPVPIAATYAESTKRAHLTRAALPARRKKAMHVTPAIVDATVPTSKLVLDITRRTSTGATGRPRVGTAPAYAHRAVSLGATQVVLDAGFSRTAVYERSRSTRVTVWYTAPTAIRMLMQDGIEPVKRRNLTSLPPHVAAWASPLNPEAVRWGHEAVRLWFHDTFLADRTGASS